ncbi:glycogen phosphorylase [Moorella thermoacetica]|uniref:Glycogen phosphorylase n=1 Tax=Neomoorella thermoacetica TaxID=1525 RepID=A0A1J5JIQ5_NEOTH|nr:glycosyltransferase family 1 protein [Moorella thermoacetica]OIQ09426.1 glycogen phosphorylase [Moorella thermoacetica]
MMPSPHIFFVQPVLPEKLKPLRDLAASLYWPRYPETAALFRDLDPDLWEETGHNSELLLRLLPAARLTAVAGDPQYTGRLEQVWQEYRTYLGAPVNRGNLPGLESNQVIAYFSAEFGLSEALPIYAGGLGFLAGDHLKSASDLGLPLVGVGLLYREGYFRQRLDRRGQQREVYSRNDFYQLPLELERRADGSPLEVQVNFPDPDRQVRARVWRARVGRLNLYLLDSDCPGNLEADRLITDRLYGGDLEKRIQQEILLGIGGVRALAALGINATIFHLNEGHSAFLGLERIRQLQARYGLDLASARELATCSNIFTTHTPVPAGIDVFPPYLMDKYFTEYYQSLGLSRHEFLALGRQDPNNQQEPFNMAVLALRLSAWANGVSQLHGQTARRMWQVIWPGVPAAEIPIGAITNGVHTTSWVGEKMAALYDRYLGTAWREDPASPASWAGVAGIPARELWQVHEEQRRELLAFARRRLAAQLREWGAGPREIAALEGVLDPGALTIGFARRFAAYKRPALLLRDPERLARILGDSRRPVQIIYAGKAHPRDEEGKELIRQITAFTREEAFRGRLIFLEDYGLQVARHLVQGVDLWLGNPRRPLEASSTSGMKAVLNGALHASTLDGWWAEAWTPDTGWAIGSGAVYEDTGYQDTVEGEALYNLLEKEIVPLFYERDAGGLPAAWVEMMKRSIRAYGPVFNTHRMVAEYSRQFYEPAARLYQRLQAGNQERLKELAGWRSRVRDWWPAVRIEGVEDDREGDLIVGGSLKVRARVFLGSLQPEDVTVELYYGPVDAGGEIVTGEKETLIQYQDQGEGRYLYSGVIPCRRGGRQGYNLRVLPRHADQVHPYQSGLILWG